jgi:hypothetical protein
MAQLFISYRSSDGRDKATALARDLGALYGDAQVFIDKDDLRAGVRGATRSPPHSRNSRYSCCCSPRSCWPPATIAWQAAHRRPR